MTNEKLAQPVCRICGSDEGRLNNADVHNPCLLALMPCSCGADDPQDCVCWTTCDWCGEVLPWDLWEQHWFACEKRLAPPYVAPAAEIWR